MKSEHSEHSEPSLQDNSLSTTCLFSSNQAKQQHLRSLFHHSRICFSCLPFLPLLICDRSPLASSQVFGKLITGVDADLMAESGKVPSTTSLVSSSSSSNGLRSLLPISSTSTHPVAMNEHIKQQTQVNQLPSSSVGPSASSGHRSETYDSEQSATTFTCSKSILSSAAIASTSTSIVNTVSPLGTSICSSGNAASTALASSSTTSAGGNNVSTVCKSTSVNATGDSNDLREHMVGILFSRSSKLSYLQKQVRTTTATAATTATATARTTAARSTDARIHLVHLVFRFFASRLPSVTLPFSSLFLILTHDEKISPSICLSISMCALLLFSFSSFRLLL